MTRTSQNEPTMGLNELPGTFCAACRKPRGCRTRSRKILEFKHYCTDPPV